MNEFVIGCISLGLVVALMMIGVPISFSFLVPGFACLLWIKGWDAGLTALGTAVVQNTNKEMLIAIPMFVLMGFFVLVSELGDDIYKTAHRFVGRTPGGLANATTVACAFFGACTGDSLGASATMSAISYPRLKQYGYDDRLSTACTAVGGTLGVLIPPSLPMITYGFLTSTSVGALFIAGIIPGIVTTLILVGTTIAWCLLNPKVAPKPTERFTFIEKIKSINGGTWGILALFLLIIFGLYFGVFAPSEAGAVGAFGALVITALRRKLNWHTLYDAVRRSCEITCFLFAIIIGAMVLQNVLLMAGFASRLQLMLTGLDVSPYVILMIVVVIWIIMGMFMDQLAIQFLTLPIFAPILANLGFDLIWLGVISIVVAEIGMISPPVGLNVFVVSGVTKVPSGMIFRGIVPYCFSLLLVIIMLTVWPQLATWLPGIMQG